MSSATPLNEAFENMSLSSDIQKLSLLIASNVDRMSTYYQRYNIPTPSLAVGAPAQPDIPQAFHFQEARRVVIEATEELRNLVLGPQELLKFDYTKNVSLHVIIRFKIHKTFAPNERTSFDAIAAKIGMSTSRLRRILRHGMAYNLFHEPRPGVVIHSALTEQLYNDAGMENCVVTILEEMAPSAFTTANALEQWPDSEEPHETGFAYANEVDKSMFDVFQDEPQRGQRFATFMSFLGGPNTSDVEILLDSYNWDCPSISRVVDVGGSHGDVMVSLAQRFPRLDCYVQDFPQIIDEGRRKLSSKLLGRVNFMAHDFFKVQPVIADVYYFRWIFHNWADKYCISILRNLIPALDIGARILIHDICVPKPGTGANITEERRARTMDMAMLIQLNAKERDEDEWAELFNKADANFRFDGIEKPPGSKLSLIMATWIGPRGVPDAFILSDEIVDSMFAPPLTLGSENQSSEGEGSVVNGDDAAISVDPREESEAPSNKNKEHEDKEDEEADGENIEAYMGCARIVRI